MNKQFYVYILTNFHNSVLYIGVTNDLNRRIEEHKEGAIEGFTKKYRLNKLIYFEEYPQIFDAIAREKQLKNWHREWKVNLIKSTNLQFNDLLLEMS